MKQFTYFDSISSNDATITKDLDHGLAKASSSFGCLQHRGFWRYITWPSEKSCHQHSSVCCGNLGAVRKTHTAAGTLPPKLPVIHHGNTLAGLCHQRRSSREGWTAKYRDNAATSTSLLGRPCLTHERHSKLWSLTNSAKVGGTEMLHAGAKRTSWSDGWHRLVLITETHWRLH